MDESALTALVSSLAFQEVQNEAAGQRREESGQILDAIRDYAMQAGQAMALADLYRAAGNATEADRYAIRQRDAYHNALRCTRIAGTAGARGA